MEKADKRLDFMSEEEIKRIDDYLTKIEQNRGKMDDYYNRWDKEQEAYSMEQPILEGHPNSRVNVLNANIEGQVASLVEQNIAVACRGEGPSDAPFADWARIGLDWTLRKNHIKKLLDRHERRRELFGSAWFKIYFDPEKVNGFGLVCITCPPLNSTFVDMKINDPLNLQDAEYIAEVMPKSKEWAKEKYGDVADNIITGGADRSSIFGKEYTTDDENIYWHIQWWSKPEGILRLEEFSEDGVLLYDSFKDEKIGKKPYYRYNKYPYFLTNLYYEEGKLLGFGDGKLLRPLQDMLNDLYDQIRRAARPNRIFFDPESEVDLADIEDDDSWLPCNDPQRTIRVVETGQVNPALWQLLNAIHEEIQRVTRFSELMLGQEGKPKTATEAHIQQQQGVSGINHKKLMLQETLVEMCEYVLDMMMEHYTEGKAFRIDENADEFIWIDFRQLNEIPVLMPATDGYIKEYTRNNPNSEIPKWQQVTDESGKGVTKSVDLDIEISVGAGLPKNKAFLYEMLDRLSRMVVEGQNVIKWTEFRDFIRDYLGLPLSDDDQMNLMVPSGQVLAQPQGAILNPNIEGLTAQGVQQPMGGLV